MAALTGNRGKVVIATDSDLGLKALEGNIFDWKISIDQELHDSTVFSPPVNASSNIQGLHSVSGTLLGYLDDTVFFDATKMISDADKADLELWSDMTGATGQKYQVKAHTIAFQPNVALGNVAGFTATFQGTGRYAAGAGIDITEIPPV